MKLLVVAACLVVAASAAPAPAAAAPEAAARAALAQLPAVLHDEVHDEHGQYTLRYVTADGTIVEERGRLVPTPDGSDYVMVSEGSVTYVGDDGKTYTTKFSAGLDGYHAEGDHLPKASAP